MLKGTGGRVSIVVLWFIGLQQNDQLNSLRQRSNDVSAWRRSVLFQVTETDTETENEETEINQILKKKHVQAG